DAPGFRTMAIRPRALIGPDDTVLLPRIMKLVARGAFPLFRRGRALVELTDVRDAARAFILSDRERERGGGRAINISGAQPAAVSDLVHELSKAIGKPLRPAFVPMALAQPLAHAAEFVCARLPGRPEPALTVYGLATLAYTQTFNLNRARDLLGYQPTH